MDGWVVSYLVGLGPLVLWQKLVLVTALDGAADTVDSVVGFLGGETAQGDLGGFALLLDEVVEPVGFKPEVSHLPDHDAVNPH